MTLQKSLTIMDRIQREYYPKPRPRIRSDDVYETAVNKYFALHELMIYVQNHPRKNPLDSVEQFRKEMDEFSCKAKAWITKYMFSCYYDVATHVLDILIWEEENKNE